MPMLLKGEQAKAVYMAEPIADIIAVMFTACLFFFRFKKTLEKENAESGGKGN